MPDMNTLINVLCYNVLSCVDLKQSKVVHLQTFSQFNQALNYLQDFLPFYHKTEVINILKHIR